MLERVSQANDDARLWLMRVQFGGARFTVLGESCDTGWRCFAVRKLMWGLLRSSYVIWFGIKYPYEIQCILYPTYVC